MEKIIDISKVQIGHIVGKGGATIKAIQSETGAKLEIIDGPKVKITGANEAQVSTAEKKVHDIISNQENPDYEGLIGKRLREEADALGAKRSKLFDEATAKRNGGDHATASKLIEEAKAAGAEMEKKNKAAAAAIAKYNNEAKGKGEDYFDMHGLREEEAIAILKARVESLEAKPEGTVTDFEVIPGAGHHSAPGKQKLKGATEAYLKEKGIRYSEASAGSFIVKVVGTGAAAAAAGGEEPAAIALAKDAAAKVAAGKAAADVIAAKTDISGVAANQKFNVSANKESGNKENVKEKKSSPKCCVVM